MGYKCNVEMRLKKSNLNRKEKLVYNLKKTKYDCDEENGPVDEIQFKRKEKVFLAFIN